MNLYSRTLPYTQMPQADQRKHPRKMFRQLVSLGVPDRQLIQGYTIDISAEGLSALIPVALKIGDVCAARFTIMIGDRVVRISGAGKLCSCVCTGSGFRIGIHFKSQDSIMQQALTQFTAV